jgi:hypothetical protein
MGGTRPMSWVPVRLWWSEGLDETVCGYAVVPLVDEGYVDRAGGL